MYTIYDYAYNGLLYLNNSLSPVAMVGLQKRYAPAVQILQRRLRKEHLISYDLHYLTGNYPEGNALLDLYIHPLDLVTYLFDKPEIIACQHVAPASYILMLRHPHIVGTLELSTAYTWTTAEESLKVCTSSGVYRLSQMEELIFESKSSTIFGIPYEKVSSCNRIVEHIYSRNNFTPTLPNNQIYIQGYFNEIQAFLGVVECRQNKDITDMQSLRTVYETIAKIQESKNVDPVRD